MDSTLPNTATVHLPPAPAEGIAGLKQNFKSDVTAGFMVFLLALPLSLGIAKASGFPPAMGVLTAMMGGLVASLFKVAPLTIKGPAAGLITVCSAAVAEFGGGDDAWKTVCGIIVVMSLFQVLLGLFKFGSLSDFFPHSAVHGMLAAIGIIIIAKQTPVLLGVDPAFYKGQNPIQLLTSIPQLITHATVNLEIIGIISLLTLFVMPLLKFQFLKRFPPPLVVLLLSVALSLGFHLSEAGQKHGLVKIGDFWANVGFQAQFSQMGSWAFWKYVVMFLFVASLESLLTVKAIDNLDPFRRESDYNGDLKAQGTANLASGLLGGLPMISEVVRSSANVGYGAKTKWANFFHGVFLLVAMSLMIPVLELIPNSALAALLIFAGYRLASPKEFIHMYRVGKEQLTIFCVTIVVTLAEDLLLGVAAGIFVEMLFHLYHGVSLKSFFRVKLDRETLPNGAALLVLHEAAIFSGVVSFKAILSRLPKEHAVVVDLSKTILVDHSFMSFLSHCQKEAVARGRPFEVTGLNQHRAFSDSPVAARKAMPTA